MLPPSGGKRIGRGTSPLWPGRRLSWRERGKGRRGEERVSPFPPPCPCPSDGKGVRYCQLGHGRPAGGRRSGHGSGLGALTGPWHDARTLIGMAEKRDA